MLQQPLARRVAGAARDAAAGERCQGHCLCRVCGVAHEAVPTDGTTDAWPGRGPGRREIERYLSVGRLRLYRSFSTITTTRSAGTTRARTGLRENPSHQRWTRPTAPRVSRSSPQEDHSL